ncbi:MAG: HAD family hydrolase [Patescibacteria group bacterium]
MKSKRYKSILLDVDGTIVPIGPHTVPSKKVVRYLNKAKSKVIVSLVSGRPVSWLTDIFRLLNITNPCIVNGGSQIIDPKTQKVLWEKKIDKKSLAKILKIIQNNKLSFLVNDGGVEYRNPKILKFSRPIAIQVSYLNSGKISKYLEKFNKIPNITAHSFPSWGKNKVDIYITHEKATKRSAVEKLAALLKIDISDMIAVGDGENDVPLLIGCGLKIAMGNAAEKLKKIADYVAPSIDNHGVAHIIEKFILHPN